MALVLLLTCTFFAWYLSTTVSGIPHMLHWLVPSRWLVVGAGLVLVTWLMRD